MAVRATLRRLPPVLHGWVLMTWRVKRALVATLLWRLGAGGLSLQARDVAKLGQRYGSLGAVVVRMLGSGSRPSSSCSAP